VGQHLCGGFQGTSVTSQAYHLIVEHRISTMILSRKNAVSVAQMSKLIKDLQYIALTEANYEYPIMFAIDEEGGMMNSLFDPDYLTQYPCAMALASTGDTELVYEILKAVAIELKKIGFLIVLGPVLDVVTKLSHQLVGVRSFGTTIEDVIKYGSQCAKGLQDGGLFTVGKHFPGMGNATVDSLLDLPMIGDSLDQIKHFNSVPFAKLIEQNLLDGVSAAGCGVPNISPDETHACLSPILLNQYLRQDLKFDGIVVSECLEMDALYHSLGLGQGVILAISAGCDLVMVCHDLNLQNEAIESLQKAVDNGNLDEEIVSASYLRVKRLQTQLPKWSELFPKGEDSAKEVDKLFKYEFPDLWAKHQKLSQLAYQKSITLVRDFNSSLPISKFITSTDKTDNIVLLTPLLNPVYQSQKEDPQLYTGEQVFQKFGDLLSNHSISKLKPYKVLHTSYTANGLTPLHESLIENSKVVIILTSEASRNMYQVGIVKYVSILCGANPNSFNNVGSSAYIQLTKPLIIVATLSPYDFFYSKSIGSAYLCCYEYTDSALEKLVGVLMGDFEAGGCIPGEKKFTGKTRKRKLDSVKIEDDKKNSIPKRRWLVDEFDLNRDWSGLVKLWKNNTMDADVGTINNNSIDYSNDGFYKKLYGLLVSSNKSQMHFVVRNSSLNILYGVILTWVVKHKEGGLQVEHDEEDEAVVKSKSPEESHHFTGSIIYLLVDKSRRNQSIGKNLHARALRYLIKDLSCKQITLGSSLPLLFFPENSNLLQHKKVTSFIQNVGWTIKSEDLRKKFIMILNDMENWLVPKKIFRELMIVGVRFDICSDPKKLLKLIDRSMNDSEAVDNIDDRQNIKSLYLEAIKHLGNHSSYGVKIIIALEPTNQSVIGSIILFTNKSQLVKFFPFIDECVDEGSGVSEEKSGSYVKSSPLIGCIIGPIIDPLYSNLTEIFKYGLICSGITFLKSSLTDNEVQINQCVMIGANNDKSINGIKEIGFHEWKYYYNYYDKKVNPEKSFK
jgi:Beta-glucosidase-related glycosidases